MLNKCTVCTIKIEKYIYKTDRNICKSCYSIIRKKYSNNTFSRKGNNKKKVVDSVNININRTLNILFSNCGKTYLVNHILLQEQEPIFIITKSLKQYPNIQAQISDESEPLENYENSIVVFDVMLLSKQESNIDLFFTGG